ncbi:Nmr based structural model of the Ubch8-ubiquitin complex [Karstenula rhodostoma CBS 690.94]|uniref:Nmr based structural model of the Ubch8-ubiquitin complex n=1 Tax=Karstenula rhodostoma CBS 690.94 TaxID=1392251 RepID=A0A9P4UHG4_9PLEO|nr:Nmr based structural model of the Ubch8-ubiquitin complex [Karstenula rhodostoma CBS 690.94]
MSQPEKIKLFVKDVNGETYTFEVHPSDLVNELKQKIQEKSGLVPDKQRLVYAGKQLQDGFMLSCYGIFQDSFLHLVLRLGGC